MNLPLSPGTYGVVGPNAAGKTTLLGEIHRDCLPDSAFARSAHHALFAGRTVGDHLAAAALPRPDFDHSVVEVLLPDLSPTTAVRRLSAGEARRLTLAATLGARTSTVLLDEPFDGLDIAHRDLIRRLLIERLGEQIHTLVLTSHRAEDLAGLVDQVIPVGGKPVLLDDARTLHPVLTGPAADVDAATQGLEVLRRDTLGGHVRAIARGHVDARFSPTYLDDVALIDLLATHGN